MAYNDYSWQVIAHDYYSPHFRNSLATHAFLRQPGLLGIPRVALGIAAKNNQIEYIVDLGTWTKAHSVLRERISSDYHVFEKLLDTIEQLGQSFTAWTDEHIWQRDLTPCSIGELLDLLDDFLNRQETMYAHGTAVVLLDFANFSFVENNLNELLRSRLPAEDYSEYFRVFTAPPQSSFAEEQEITLLTLMQKYFSFPGWQSAVAKATESELQRLYPAFVADLAAHTAKYAWVYYVYMGPAFTTAQFLDFIRDYLHKGINPEMKLKEIAAQKTELKLTKEKYRVRLKPSKFESAIIDLAGRIVWAKPRRKDYQSKAYYHVEKLQREIARRFALTLDQVRSAPRELLRAGAGSGEVDVHIINEILQFHICLPSDDSSVVTLSGTAAKEFNQKIKRQAEADNYQNLHEIKGTTACSGRAQGVVRIVNVPADMAKMDYGDILVSSATTPSIVAAMKKAAAIVTDEGGLTCHASIVSRELNIPCVIGTKISTRVLRDGDMVEVDATAGIIKKL